MHYKRQMAFSESLILLLSKENTLKVIEIE